jgi:hypothetical protein
MNSLSRIRDEATAFPLNMRFVLADHVINSQSRR